MTDLEEQEDYEVRIGSFNGPMDLLVYLVQKKEMSLDQIPIAEIADDFLAWVNKIGVTDLSKAGDFLYMASRLMALKVQELLPAEERDPELVEEYNADREKLMQEMLEYQRYKQVAGGLQDMEGKNFGTFSRGRLEKTQTDEETLADANIWQLFRAYQKSLKTKISDTVHHIELDYVTIQDRQQAINNYLSVNGRALFEDLLDNDSHPIVAAVTFMALLEMIKTDEVVFRQSELFGPIWIYRKKNNAEYAEEMARETVFYSKDPDVKPGLVEEIRNMALARSQAGSVGDIAAVMKEAVLWTTRGREVTEENLEAMLEGREDLSEVQDNPFAEMMKEDDAAEAAAGMSSPAGDGNARDVNAGIETAGSSTAGNSPANASAGNTPAGDSTAGIETAGETAAEAQPAGSETIPAEPVTESAPESHAPAGIETAGVSPANSPAGTETAGNTTAGTVNAGDSTAGNSPAMSDEEFAEFMRKAQAFYDKQGTTAQDSPAENSDNPPRAPEDDFSDSDDDEDEGPTIYGADDN